MNISNPRRRKNINIRHSSGPQMQLSTADLEQNIFLPSFEIVLVSVSLGDMLCDVSSLRSWIGVVRLSRPTSSLPHSAPRVCASVYPHLCTTFSAQRRANTKRSSKSETRAPWVKKSGTLVRMNVVHRLGGGVPLQEDRSLQRITTHHPQAGKNHPTQGIWSRQKAPDTTVQESRDSTTQQRSAQQHANTPHTCRSPHEIQVHYR